MEPEAREGKMSTALAAGFDVKASVVDVPRLNQNLC